MHSILGYCDSHPCPSYLLDLKSTGIVLREPTVLTGKQITDKAKVSWTRRGCGCVSRIGLIRSPHLSVSGTTRVMINRC